MLRYLNLLCFYSSRSSLAHREPLTRNNITISTNISTTAVNQCSEHAMTENLLFCCFSSFFIGFIWHFFSYANVDPDLFFCADVLCLCCVVGSEPLISRCVSGRVPLHFKRSCCERLYYHSSLWAQQHDSCPVHLWPTQITLSIASPRPLSPHPYIPASFSSLCFRLSPFFFSFFCSFHEQIEPMSTVFCRKQLLLTGQLSHYILRILLVQWSRVRFYCLTINIRHMNFFLVINSQSGDGTETSQTMSCWILTFAYHLNCSTKLIINMTNNE